MFSLLRTSLFALPPETAHGLSLHGLSLAEKMGLAKLLPSVPALPVTVMGLQFPNPVGLAAGLDKNAAHIDGLAALGFGFIEVGTVTPRPQPGNARPRVFRLPEHEAIINRMGFNNQGLEALLRNVANKRRDVIVGINVGKNRDTPVHQAADDYCLGIERVYGSASYITVNVSSPNTPGLRELQFGEALRELLARIRETQLRMADRIGRYVPVAVKIAPDMDNVALGFVADCLVGSGLDAVIATNTTVDRSAVADSRHAAEAGGLSGRPLASASTAIIRGLNQHLQGALPIIGVGGIADGASAKEKIEAGASLVQVYTGFIYHGPRLIKEAVEAISQPVLRQ